MGDSGGGGGGGRGRSPEQPPTHKSPILTFGERRGPRRRRPPPETRARLRPGGGVMNRRRTSTHVLTHTARRSQSEYMVAELVGGKVVTTALTNVRDVFCFFFLFCPTDGREDHQGFWPKLLLKTNKTTEEKHIIPWLF